MTKLPTLLALALFTPVAFSASVVTKYSLAENFDGTRDTEYQEGNKPQPGCSPPSGWTEEDKGTGSGTVCDTAGTWAFNVLGNSASNGLHFVYRSITGDAQLVAKIGDYSGATGNFAGLGIGLTDGLDDSAAFKFCWSPQSFTSTVRLLQGTPGNTTNSNGAVGRTRPTWVGETWDDSENEYRCYESDDGENWTFVGSSIGAVTTPYFYVGGQAGSLVESLLADVTEVTFDEGADAITIYDPDPVDPPDPGNHAPVCSAIPNQSGTQGVAFSLDVSDFCSDEDLDTLSYSATGLSGRGLSIDSSTGIISGTPNATAVSASPFNVTVTVSDPEPASVQAIFSMVVSIPPETGDVFNIASGTSSFNCATQGVGPSDVLQLASGTRGPLTIMNCTGSASSPITIRNNPAAGSRTTIRKSNGNGGGFVWVLNNMQHVVIDGTQKWSGAPAGQCGISQTAAFPTKGTTQCGIRLETDGAEPGPSAWIKIGGANTKNLTLKGVEVDGSGTTGGGGIGITCNDHAFKWQGSGVGNWREDIKLINNYVHDVGVTGGEGIYCGPNAYGEDGGDGTNDLPVRRVEIAYNYVHNTAREGINAKYWLQGPNSIHHNVVEDAGEANQQGQGNAINAVSGSKVSIFNNIVKGTHTAAVVCTNNDAMSTGVSAEPDTTPIECNIYNNVIEDAGSRCAQITKLSCPNDVCSGNSHPGKNGKLIEMNPSRIYNNTCIDPGTNGAISIDSNIAGATRIVRDNLLGCAGACTTSAGASGGVNTNNRVGTVGSLGFVNAAGSDFHLTSGSSARNSGTANCPSTDIDDDARPQQGACDQGADEYVP